MGYDISTHKATIWDEGTFPFSVSTREQITQAVVKILQHPEETANKPIYISSFNTSMNEILASLENATATNWEVEYVKTAEMINEGQKMLMGGNFMGLGIWRRRLTFRLGMGLILRLRGCWGMICWS
jgi:hypothetical protein